MSEEIPSHTAEDPKKADYQEHYKRFSENIAFAARQWHTYVEIRNRSAKDETLLAALNEAPRFWLDYNYTAVQTVVIFLGKIFDPDGDAHSVQKTLKTAFKEIGYFGKEKLRTRKLALGPDWGGLDNYIANAHELQAPGLKQISAELKKAVAIWKKIKPLRDKVYAHQEIMTDEERAALYNAVKNADVENVLQILLNISYALEQAELNGGQPDFDDPNTSPIVSAKKEAGKLIELLKRAYTSGKKS